MKKKHGMAPIEEIIDRWLRANKIPQRLDKQSVFSRWKEVVGEEVGAQTRPVDIRSGELIVEVNSAPLLNELSTYYSQEILESLQQIEEFRKIHAIRFRAGSF